MDGQSTDQEDRISPADNDTDVASETPYDTQPRDAGDKGVPPATSGDQGDENPQGNQGGGGGGVNRKALNRASGRKGQRAPSSPQGTTPHPHSGRPKSRLEAGGGRAGRSAGRAAKATQAAGRAGMAAARTGAVAAAPETLGGSVLAEAGLEAGKQAAQFAKQGPVNYFRNKEQVIKKAPQAAQKWIFGCVGALTLGFFIFMGVFASIIGGFLPFFSAIGAQANPAPDSELTITKTVDKNTASVGEEIAYTIHVVTTNPTITDIRVTDTLTTDTDTVPERVSYVKEKTNGIPSFDEKEKTVTWSTKESFPSTPRDATFTLVVKADKDILLKNRARAEIVGKTSEITTPNSLPTSDRKALLDFIKKAVDEGNITFSHNNDKTGMTIGAGKIPGQVLRTLDGKVVKIDTQVLRAYVYLVQQGFTFKVSSMIGTHSRLTSSGNVSRHWDGHAFDVSAINGKRVESPAAKTATISFMKTLNALIGKDLAPSQLICQGNGRRDPQIDALSMNKHKISRGFSAIVGDHTDHVHVGY